MMQLEKWYRFIWTDVETVQGILKTKNTGNIYIACIWNLLEKSILCYQTANNNHLSNGGTYILMFYSLFYFNIIAESINYFSN